MYLYKYVDRKNYNRYMNNYPIQKKTYKVVKETPKGYWISEIFQSGNISSFKKWISKHTNHHRKFAFENEEDAIRHYRFKKAAQIRILTENLVRAEERYKIAVEKDVTYRPRDENQYSRWVVNGRPVSSKKYPMDSRFKGGFITEEEMSL